MTIFKKIYLELKVAHNDLIIAYDKIKEIQRELDMVHQDVNRIIRLQAPPIAHISKAHIMSPRQEAFMKANFGRGLSSAEAFRCLAELTPGKSPLTRSQIQHWCDNRYGGIKCWQRGIVAERVKKSKV